MLKVFQNASNLLSLSSPSNEDNSRKLEIFKNKPFYFELQEHNGIDDCFNCTIGLPTKDNIQNPLFDYEKIVLDSLQNHKHLWILKSTGLGITELFLRYMSYLCLRNNDYQNSQMVIVTGPNIDLSIKLIRRMKNLFYNKLDITFDSKETVLELNKCRIEAYPSNHIDSFRSLDNPKFILLEEADFFRKNEQEDVRAVAERYIAKSNPYIVMVSTPNAPGGLMQTIENEPADTCLYKRIKLDYRYGLYRIYSKEDIEKAKQSPAFDREYDLKYLGKIGNLYSQLSIDNAVKRGTEYNPDEFNPYSEKYISIDEAFSVSKFAIMVAEFQRSTRQIRILHAEELDKPLYENALDHILRLRKKYGNVQNIAFDASRPELGTSLKKRIGERYDWQYVQDKLQYCKKHNLDIASTMIVCPIVFSAESRSVMTSHSRRILDDSRGLIAIHPMFDKLITSLKSAQFEDSGRLLKDESPFNDILDCFQLICTFFKYKTTSENDKINILSL
jgi:hypothetical protein